MQPCVPELGTTSEHDTKFSAVWGAEDLKLATKQWRQHPKLRWFRLFHTTAASERRVAR
jgi:hypothetical protein